jgi:hypothetical protein
MRSFDSSFDSLTAPRIRSLAKNGPHVVAPLKYQTGRNLKARSGVSAAGIAVKFVLVSTIQ